MSKVPKQLTPFKKGQSGNPKGRPIGSRSFKTLVNEAIIKIATDTGQDPLELERDIVVKGLLSARKGDYRFYKDTMDRVHGSATQKTDITTGGEKIQPVLVEIINDKQTTDDTNSEGAE